MALDPAKVKILIFDLDDTLFDTHGQLLTPARQESCQAMIKAGLEATVDQCLSKWEHLHKTQPRKNIYKELVTTFDVKNGFDPQKVERDGYAAFYDRQIKETISLFPDTADTLTLLSKTFKIYLVTMGSPQTQKKKVNLLNVEKYFEKIYFVDSSQTSDKKKAFEDILRQTKVAPDQHISIGNRVDLEIRDAKRLGMKAILFEHGEYFHLSPETEDEKPDLTIRNLSELIRILS